MNICTYVFTWQILQPEPSLSAFLKVLWLNICFQFCRVPICQFCFYNYCFLCPKKHLHSLNYKVAHLYSILWALWHWHLCLSLILLDWASHCEVGSRFASPWPHLVGFPFSFELHRCLEKSTACTRTVYFWTVYSALVIILCHVYSTQHLSVHEHESFLFIMSSLLFNIFFILVQINFLTLKSEFLL